MRRGDGMVGGGFCNCALQPSFGIEFENFSKFHRLYLQIFLNLVDCDVINGGGRGRIQ